MQYVFGGIIYDYFCMYELFKTALRYVLKILLTFVIIKRL